MLDQWNRQPIRRNSFARTGAEVSVLPILRAQLELVFTWLQHQLRPIGFLGLTD
jgi:hypothetical protein